MKVMSFFSEKGGVGKTTLTAMFASYLAYGCGEKVCVMDFDHPSYHLSKMRDTDLRLVNDPANMAFIRAVGQCSPYTIGRPAPRASYTSHEMETLVRSMRRQKESGDGYFLLDFPGRFSPQDPVYHFAAAGLIDMFVVPVDSDRQSFTSAMLLWDVLHTGVFLSAPRSPRMVVLWNRENTAERSGKRDWYGDKEAEFVRAGVPVLPVRIHDMLIMRRDPDTFGFLRSTLCWPRSNVASRAPDLPQLFGDIRRMLEE